MAQHGIQFTILAPSQAKSMDGVDVTGQRIDPTRAYRQKLPSGRSINLFFYDGPVSQAVAFERLLNDGGRFAQRLLDALSDQREGPQLAHIATDGETYGHHHAFGDMALAYALDHIESSGLAKVTNYGEFLEKHPAEHDVEILENTAWSCVHGVGRWNANCGCNSGGHGEWNQEWRAPLRAALDWLRDEIAPCYEKMAGRFFKDPWAARNNYIHVILDRSPESRERFAAANFRRKIDEGRRSRERLEAARNAAPRHADVHQLRLVLRRAHRHRNGAGDPIRRTRGATGRGAVSAIDIERRVSWRSWRSPRATLPSMATARAIYEKFVKPASVDLLKLGAHYAMSSLFESYPGQHAHLRLLGGQQRLPLEALGQNAAGLRQGPLHFGNHAGFRHADVRRAPLRRPQSARRRGAVPLRGSLSRAEQVHPRCL